MLQILEGYDFSEIEFGSAEHLHLFTEAKKLAFEDRAKYYADMDFVNVPVEELLSDAYAEERRKQIGDRAGTYTAGEISAGEYRNVVATGRPPLPLNHVRCHQIMGTAARAVDGDLRRALEQLVGTIAPGA